MQHVHGAIAVSFVFNGPENADWLFVFAHGAGAGMETPFMDAVAQGMAEQGILVGRFEFPYMRKRRDEGSRRPPDRAPVLLDDFEHRVRQARADFPDKRIAIGGKSMGGRMASMIGEKADAVIAFGYPFHPPGKPDRLRTGHLQSLSFPMLIVQGERDPFGARTETEGFDLDAGIHWTWLEDGDHSFKPRKKSGFSEQEHWQKAVDAAVEFLASVSLGLTPT